MTWNHVGRLGLRAGREHVRAFGDVSPASVSLFYRVGVEVVLGLCLLVFGLCFVCCFVLLPGLAFEIPLHSFALLRWVLQYVVPFGL